MNAGQKAKQIGLILAGYLQADDDVYSNRRNKITVIEPRVVLSEPVSPKKGEDKHVNAIDKAKIEFIKKHTRIRKDGRYEYRAQIEGKKECYSDKDFNTVINLALGKIKRKARTKKQNSPPLVDYCWQYYNLFRVMNRSRSSEEEYKNIIDNHIAGYFKCKPIHLIQTEELQSFINEIKGETIRKKIFNFIRAVFKKASALEIIKKNTAEAIELPKNNKTSQKRGLWFEEQVKLLNELKNCDTDFQKFVIFSLVIGSRREETCSFHLADIDKQKQLLHIRGTKTANADRFVKISASMIAFLEQDYTGSPDELFFKVSPNGYYHHLRRIYKKSKFTNVDLHSLRRTCSSNLYYLGVPDKQRQQILGHASIVTTNDIYTFLEPDMNLEKVQYLYKSLYYSDYGVSRPTF